MKRILSLAVSIIVVSLMTIATHAQTDSLKLRVHVPFPFTVENTTFAAGEYEITQPARSVLELRNLQSQAAAFEHVEAAHSQKEANGRMRLIFHRYGSEYFLATVSDGSWQSTYDLRPSKEEKQLADASPMPHLKVVSVLANGTVPTSDDGRK
jgi:hypothetical protein